MNLTIGITSFMRERLTRRLVDSIRRFYPEIQIFIADDSNIELFWAEEAKNINLYRMEYDSGLSAKRNLLVQRCKTKNILLLDNDYEFTANTNLERALSIKEDNRYDLLGLATMEGNAELPYNGLFETVGTEVRYVKSVGKYHFVGNFFVADVDTLKRYPWDEELKVGEHFAYFYEHKDKIRIGYTNEVSAQHKHEDDGSIGYGAFRGRATEFVKKYMVKKGLTKRIDLGGNIITV